MSTNPNLTYSYRMEPVEFTRVEILSVIMQSCLINTAQAVITTKYINLPHNVDLSRVELIALLQSSGTGVYYNGIKLILEQVNGISYIHKSPAPDPCDIIF